MDRCFYCDKADDLRPYGPRGEWVCHPCAMATPERKEAAKMQFLAQLQGAGPVAAIDGTNVGPYPIEHNKDAADALLAALETER